MNSVNFKYWLQGWLEGGTPQSMDADKIELLMKHIAIVSNPDNFVHWLKGYVDGALAGPGVLNYGNIEQISKELAKHFNNITENTQLEDLLRDVRIGGGFPHLPPGLQRMRPSLDEIFDPSRTGQPLIVTC